VVAPADQRLDLRALIEAAEAAPPIDAVDVLAFALAEMLDATHVSLLISNFSGTAVMRMSHVSSEHALREGRNERAEALPLADTSYERVLFRQELEITEDGDGWLILVPVTERGDAIGLLELPSSRGRRPRRPCFRRRHHRLPDTGPAAPAR
jgi:hypothetical protein